MKQPNTHTKVPYISEEFLSLVSKKCELSKRDLEKNWLYQIIGVGVSLGLVFGLGKLISKYFFNEVGHDYILYLILPLINLYLFMRFGFLASAFSDARLSLERLAETYFEQRQIRELPKLNDLSPEIISRTNSYFEYYYRGKHRFSIFLYTLFVPFIFACSHSTSAYLISMLLSSPPLAAIVTLIYFIPIGVLYHEFYLGNKGITLEISRRSLNFVLTSILISLLLTITLLFLLYRTNLQILYGASIE